MRKIVKTIALITFLCLILNVFSNCIFVGAVESFTDTADILVKVCSDGYAEVA